MKDFNLVFYLTSQWLVVGLALAAFVVAGEIGWRIGRARRSDDEHLRALVGGVAAATLGLLGLLLGFALSMAIGRFDARREVIVREANAIGTLSLRAGLLEPGLRDELRAALREYLVTRIALRETGSHLEALLDAKRHAEAIHPRIWGVVERAGQGETRAAPPVHAALIAAANEVIDLHELRLASLENYVPAPVILLLIGVGVIAVGLIGWSFGLAQRRASVAMSLLSLLLACVLLVIIDLNRPHRGMVRVGQESLHRLQRSLDAAATP